MYKRQLFDCIEFNDLLSEIDVLYDVAFLIMDLWFRGRREPANRVLNAYLDEAARAFPPVSYTHLDVYKRQRHDAGHRR